MRELANLSAHNAIDRHARKQAKLASFSKLLVVALGLTVGTLLLRIWWTAATSEVTFYAAMVSFVVALFCEHFFFHGVMPAAFRTGHRWPDSAQLDRSAQTPWRRLLQWLGFAQPTDTTANTWPITRWLGLKEGCAGAILVSGLLFGAVHSGKDGRELFLSYPGGVFLGYMAYRCNSWFAPFFLHLGTVAVAAAIFLLARNG